MFSFHEQCRHELYVDYPKCIEHYRIEKKFNIKFKLADVRDLKNVGDLLDLVARMV